MQTLDFTRPGTAIGAGRRRAGGVRARVEYEKERVHLRRADRDATRAVNFMIADMATEDRSGAPPHVQLRGCSTRATAATL